MNTEILLDMLFEVLSKRRVTANYLAEKYNVSERTVYRYVEALSHSVPLFVKRGRNGGVYLADSYKLPVGFLTEAEYQATKEALALTYAQTADERFLNAKRKLSATLKKEHHESAFTGEIGDFLIIDSPNEQQAILTPIQESIKSKTVLEITLSSEKRTPRKIEPHTLLLRGGEWYLFAFCHLRRGFETFPIKSIHSVLKTGEAFHKRPFEKSDISLFH